MSSSTERLQQQFTFIAEVDKVKNIFRRSYISDGSRKENDAEHSWHFALMVLILIEHANDDGLDILKILKMALIHDIVEIDAGDTYIYDTEGKKSQYERESRAADRIFGLLPENQEIEFRAIWEEFEAAETDEAIFARSIDRLHPMFLNHLAGGRAWKEHNLSEEQVRNVNRPIGEGSKTLWHFAESLIEENSAKGILN